ncbi:hypothetical protein PV326_004913 [Microctonus aethiopoides]|nr:hypothetical protein PV326_004913 [Microctonus aethiopoides]
MQDLENIRINAGQKNFSQCDDIPHHDPNMHAVTISAQKNIIDDVEYDETDKQTNDETTEENHTKVINLDESETLPKNLFWIPDVTESQIAWQKRILDSMIVSYQQQKKKGFQLEISEIDKELCTDRAGKVKIVPNWECYLRKGRFLQILSRHDAANWTKIVLEILIEVYGNTNLKYMYAKGTRNTIGMNQNLRYAIMDLLFSLKVEITEEQLTKTINKFCSNRKHPKRSADRSTTNDREMPLAKKNAPSRNNILDCDGPPPSQLMELGGHSNQNYFFNDNYSISEAICLSTNIK